MSKRKMSKYHLSMKNVLIGIAILLLITTLFVSPESSVDKKVWQTGAIFLLGIILWITNALPSSLTGVLVIVLFSVFGVLTFEEAASGLGYEIIWLVIAILFLGMAVEKHSLDKRIAYSLLALSKGNIRLILLNLIISSFVLTFLIPNAVGRLSVLLPIGKGIIESVEKENDENIGKSVMLVVTYAPYLTAVAVMTGASGSIYATGLFESMLGYSWSYLEWMLLMLPITVMTLISLWAILILLFPARNTKIKDGQKLFEQERDHLGPITLGEKKLLALYVLLISLWITRDFHHLSIPLSAVIVLILLFIPGINLLNWKESVVKVDWGVPIIFAAGFAIAMAFESSGVVYLLSDIAVSLLKEVHIYILGLLLMLLLALLRLCFANFNAMVATLMPVALTFAVSTAYNPLWIGMLCLIASSLGYLLPTQAIGSMMTFSLGYYNNIDMLKAGGLLTASIIVITLLFSFLYWPLIGLSPFL